jgi:hypothetical protein
MGEIFRLESILDLDRQTSIASQTARNGNRPHGNKISAERIAAGRLVESNLEKIPIHDHPV